MKVLFAFGHARVAGRPRIAESENGDQFVQLSMQFSERDLKSGARFQQRITFRSFAPSDRKLVEDRTITEGSLIYFDGDCDAVAEQGDNGRWYANPRVTGRILRWEGGAA